MKSPLLILFIIFNLLAVSMVSAGNMYDEQTSESHLVSSLEDSILANCIDESSCSDFCHVVSHMVGVISYASPVIELNTSISFIVMNEAIHSLTLEPTQKPPQNLI